jgi:hypothetical protein
MYASDDNWNEIDLEGKTHGPSAVQETSQIRISHQAKTNVSGTSFSRTSKGAIDVRNDFKAYFNGPTAAIPSQNQQYYLRCMFTVAPHYGTFVMYKAAIQGVPGGKDLTSGECSLDQTIPI